MKAGKLIARENIADWVASQRAQNKNANRSAKIVFTNGCFDILHSGHVALLEEARALGDCLIVGINSDASVRRLKGDSRPINAAAARAGVLCALQDVDAVCVFEEDTPIPLLEDVRPDIHVKGGDYKIADLPEANTVKKHGGEIVIVPLREGFSTTGTLEKLQAQTPKTQNPNFKTVVVIPARYNSSRFPGKPLAQIGDKTVIERAVLAALETCATRPVFVATDDARIAGVIEDNFIPEHAVAVMTSENCATGTDRLAEVVREKFAAELEKHLIIVNVQGDEPFINPAHLDALIAAMQAGSTPGTAAPRMATLATPLETEDTQNANVVKVVVAQNGDALYFSRLPIPFAREESEQENWPRLRHLGVYAYEANWLLQMASLPPSPLEEIEKLEQLRALENGTPIRVVTVENVVPIAIDTPEDLAKAQQFWSAQSGV
jgi:3-deoxy-manno-octulosonate cytidylyltransferase (CMP-KDO synthetase)